MHEQHLWDVTRVMSVIQKSVNLSNPCSLRVSVKIFLFFVINCHLGGLLVRIFILIYIWLQAKCLELVYNFIANNLRKKMGLRHFPYHTPFSQLIGLHLGRISNNWDISTFVGIPPFSNPLWVAIKTMHFHIAHTDLFRTPSFRIQGVPMNNLAPMKNCPGV